ncbi:magnesium transporter CorA family protein [Limimaricola hongkongensis]|uniref:Magnesium and cobalt transport protein CorA n=1 Tax=Limimaricola hongkongensis DSM 17492 TaxID=1122180 RepID=A0A017HA18_9RHOB|nr:magnesium transporter CorA family protein [Limimaricola hongkongensis]EYD71352.1 Magnesium and cobalt transport protein CorA [Limimaricola hongkongensis DSM 17492]
MLSAYLPAENGLAPLGAERDLGEALWIDLCGPDAEETARVESFGIGVPTLEDMEEIEISNRLHREGDCQVMTVMLPGRDAEDRQFSAPVTFLLTPDRLVTVRHHTPRPFATFATRAERSSAGSGTPVRIFLGLVEEIIARQADLLEAAGRVLDRVASDVYGEEMNDVEGLRLALRDIGQQGELTAKVRLALFTMERMLSTFMVWNGTMKHRDPQIATLAKAQMRDINALEVHLDFLNSRVALATDATLGMINLDENAVVRTLSVVAALFLPPTLIASIYGMNFANMPELDEPFAYYIALGAMVASAAGTWIWFKAKGWL